MTEAQFPPQVKIVYESLIIKQAHFQYFVGGGVVVSSRLDIASLGQIVQYLFAPV